MFLQGVCIHGPSQIPLFLCLRIAIISWGKLVECFPHCHIQFWIQRSLSSSGYHLRLYIADYLIAELKKKSDSCLSEDLFAKWTQQTKRSSTLVGDFTFCATDTLMAHPNTLKIRRKKNYWSGFNANITGVIDVCIILFQILGKKKLCWRLDINL